MGKKQTNLTLGISEPQKVDDFVVALQHPLKEVVVYLRKLILESDARIGEGIYWNAPTFYYTGEMKLFEPTEYRRYLTGFVINRPDCIRLVFLRGSRVKKNPGGLLSGDYRDGRRLATIGSLDEAKRKSEDLREVIIHLVESVNDF